MHESRSVRSNDPPPGKAPTGELQDIPRPHEPWHVEDDEVLACIPPHGFIKDYMEYCPTTCDGPLWFQLGGVLTMMSVVAAGCDYRLGAANGRYEIGGLHLWSANVGYTGTRKSQCIRPALEILRSVNSKAILATDGSIEAIHDTLADDRHRGVGLFHRDEMSTLFAQAKRSYSTGLIGWMLEAYNGGPTERVTKAGGPVEIPRVRLSVLGNIPPTTLQQNTSREDWRTGFLPRFCFWGARRTRYMPVAPGDPIIEGTLSDWLKRYIHGRPMQIIIPYEVGKILTDWHRSEIDSKGHAMPDELYSALLRLRSKGCQFAALYALSRLDYVPQNDAKILVEPQDIEYALEIVKLLRRSVIELFGYVGGTEEATQEQLALTHIATAPRASTSTLAAALGISIKAATGICQTLISQGLIERGVEKREGRGRPRAFYFVP